MALTEREKGAHLLRRFGLGASEAELDYYLQGGYAAAVERLLAYEEVEEGFPVKLEDLKSGKTPRVAMPAVVLWWTARMIMTRRPLQEKLTLFWHDHFATSAGKVGAPLLMAQQNETLRRNAAGSFPAMLLQVSQDPAMLFWLDNQQNVKGKANENFAREVMELFTLGIGNYTEEDVKEAARAFTGWSYRRRRDEEMGGAVGEFLLRRAQHDAGQKTVLGQVGPFGGEDVLDILVKQQRAAEYLTEKILRWFVMPNPPTMIVKRFAAIFRDNDMEIKPLLRAIMLSDEFISTASARTLIKNPVDFVIPTLRQLGVGQSMASAYEPEKARRILAPAASAAQSMRGMGMHLFYPPDVAGWEGGESWITSATMVERMRWAERLARSTPLQSIFANRSPEAITQRISSLLDAPLSPPKRTAVAAAVKKGLETNIQAGMIAGTKLIFASPEFQMA